MVIARAQSAPRAGGTDFWSALAPDDAAALLARGTVRRFARGQALMHEGQHADRVLLLKSGHVKALCTTAGGREVVLSFCGPGELIGELAFLDEETRSASVVAVEQVEALSVSLHDFRRFLSERPSASLALLAVLSRRLRNADAKRIEFAALNSIGRVATRLLELGERFGVEDDGAVRIGLPVTQEEIAGLVGASLESVGRSLQTMRRVGWIETGRRQIWILDADALRRAAA
jgi:CRP/FNR family cyclic AMP-dependent transcriptional regulator